LEHFCEQDVSKYNALYKDEYVHKVKLTGKLLLQKLSLFELATI
jgi:hypothetical protein